MAEFWTQYHHNWAWLQERQKEMKSASSLKTRRERAPSWRPGGWVSVSPMACETGRLPGASGTQAKGVFDPCNHHLLANPP